MTMTGDRYILTGKHDHERLQMISEIHDGRTRDLLVHLQRPVDAMRAIYAALKPGGVMVCEEADVSAV